VSADALADLQADFEEQGTRLDWALKELDECRGRIKMLEGMVYFEAAYRNEMVRRLERRVSAVDGGHPDDGELEVEMWDEDWRRGQEELDRGYLFWQATLEEDERQQARDWVDSGYASPPRDWEIEDSESERRATSGAEMDVDGRESSSSESTESESEDEEEDQRIAAGVLARQEARAEEEGRRAAEALLERLEAKRLAKEAEAAAAENAAEGAADDEEEWGGIGEDESAEGVVKKTKAELKKEKRKRKRERLLALQAVKGLRKRR
jgi:hypothetical protein